MARGDKNYSERTHKVVDKSSDAKQKEVWDMVGAKKKLHDMVEALINSDSKAAAAALHDYLQVKTRAILGETDHEEGDDEMVADRHEDGEDHEDGECAECGMDPCECEHEEHDDEDMEDGEGHEDHEEMDDEVMGEGARGEAVSTDSSVKTKMHKHASDAKDLERKVKGKLDFNKGSRVGTKSDSSGEHKTAMHKNSMGSKDLESKVKGNVKFKTNGKAKLTHPHNNAAPGLDRKVKGNVKF